MPVARGFKILEHPADIGVEAEGRDMREAFEEAARGLLSTLVAPGSVRPLTVRNIQLDGRDSENLLVRWLSEILYLLDGERFLVANPAIESLTPNRLIASVVGEMFDPSKHQILLDVKAITYHQLSVNCSEDVCKVQVFFDI